VLELFSSSSRSNVREVRLEDWSAPGANSIIETLQDTLAVLWTAV